MAISITDTLTVHLHLFQIHFHLQNVIFGIVFTPVILIPLQFIVFFMQCFFIALNENPMTIYIALECLMCI